MLMRGILVKCCVTVGLLQTILCVGQAVNADSISPPIGDDKTKREKDNIQEIYH